MRTGEPHIVVVGGGLAGLSAAIACADSGAEVTLFEARPRLGGATWSFERNGLVFDNGQHVFLRCCTAYRGFLGRLGTADRAILQRRLAIPVLRPDPGGGAPRIGWVRRNSLPAPAHLAFSLARYRHLALGERARVARAVLALRKLSLEDPGLDSETFAAFLARNGQSRGAIERLWDLITLPTVNLRAEEASLTLGAKVFRTGLIDRTDAADVGWARVPLDALHVDPAAALLERLGGSIRRRAKVDAVDLADNGPKTITGVVVDGEHVEADAVVLAVPHRVAATILPEGGIVNPARLESLGASPIVDVHVVYDRRVTEYAIAAGVDTPVQFVFDKTTASGRDAASGQVLAVSISCAETEQGERPEALIERYTGALRALLPGARSAEVVDAVVSREHEATFRGVPGTARLRPGPETGFGRLFLAGAWTDTGWPATMEGAVRSGMRAARHALRAVGTTRAPVDLDRGVVA
ncbi:MAG: hydroxysqualene dehydroxylase HpnE [Acidimicrobiales bacterium]